MSDDIAGLTLDLALVLAELAAIDHVLEMLAAPTHGSQGQQFSRSERITEMALQRVIPPKSAEAES